MNLNQWRWKALLCSLTPDELVVDYNVDSAKSGALAEGTMEMFHIKEVYESIYADDICSIPLVLNDVYSLVETDTERILRKKDITGQIRFPETIPDWTDDRKRLKGRKSSRKWKSTWNQNSVYSRFS